MADIQKYTTPTLLLVEDEIAHADLIIRLLPLNVLGIHVFDGEEALAFLDRGHVPTLILLDLNLPRMTGLEVLRAIRDRADTAKQPVVIMSTSDSPVDVQSAYEAGANGYVVKPFNFVEYEHTISTITKYWLGINVIG